mmetsp:Transcript_1728/g.2898  ORF Transcript_1728/g.2898 Transcript_1728/m.2898 type:complete len:287 (+) Transcript_1728:42-902(+)
MTSTNTNNNQNINEILVENNVLKRQLEQRDWVLHDLQKTVEFLKREVESREQATSTNLINRVDQSIANQVKLQNEIGDLQAMLALRDETIRVLKNDLQLVTQHNEQLQQTSGENNFSKELANQHISKLNDELKEERAKTARLRQTVSELRAELAAASEANASLSAQHDDTLRNLNDTHDELQQVTANHLLSATKRKRLRALTNELLNKYGGDEPLTNDTVKDTPVRHTPKRRRAAQTPAASIGSPAATPNSTLRSIQSLLSSYVQPLDAGVQIDASLLDIDHIAEE